MHTFHDTRSTAVEPGQRDELRSKVDPGAGPAARPAPLAPGRRTPGAHPKGPATSPAPATKAAHPTPVLPKKALHPATVDPPVRTADRGAATGTTQGRHGSRLLEAAPQTMSAAEHIRRGEDPNQTAVEHKRFSDELTQRLRETEQRTAPRVRPVGDAASIADRIGAVIDRPIQALSETRFIEFLVDVAH